MTIILEKSEGGFGAWLEDCPVEFTGIHTFGESVNEVTENIKMLMADLLENEFKDTITFIGFNPNTVVFNYRYSLMDFFDVYKSLKINSIADLAGLNKSLVRQYASGAATASAAQVQKIQEAVRSLAQSLLQVEMV